MSDEIQPADAPAPLRSKVYTATRRFDLLTVFMLFGLVSILLGILSLFGTPPTISVYLVGLILCMAIIQAALEDGLPRGVSCMAGLLYCGWIFPFGMVLYTRSSDPLSMIPLGIILGPFLGYVIGILVAGVFLVMDRLRQRRTTPDSNPPVGFDDLTD